MTLATTADLVQSERRPAPADGLSVSIAARGAVADEDVLAWRRLAETAPGSIVFQTPEFIDEWARCFPERAAGLAIVRVHDRGSLVGVLAVTVERWRLITVARLAGAPVGQYDDMLVHPAADAGRVAEAAFEALRRECGVDVVLFDRIRGDAALNAAARRFVRIGAAERAPYTALGTDADAFMASLKKRVRRQLAKRRRQLCAMGACETAQAAGPQEAAAWMREALKLKRDWLLESGRISRAFADPGTARLLVAAAQAGAVAPRGLARSSRTRLVLSRLSVAGKTAAIEAGFVCRDDYHLYLGAYSPELAKYGPGNVLKEAVFRACIAGGLRRYDMLVPESRNKREWAKGAIEVSGFALPLSVPGRLHVLIVHQALRPTARRLFYLLPVGVRSRIAGAILARYAD